MKKLLLNFLVLAALDPACTLHAQGVPFIEWQKSLGGTSEDYATSVQQTTDGGFIVAGVSGSNDSDVSGNNGAGDYWIVKLGVSGNLVWQKSLGGSKEDQPRCIQQTADGGFIVAGWTASNDSDVSENHGGYDYWIVKLDVGGNLVWQKSLGGSDYDEAYSVQQTADGGFIVAGYSWSIDGNVSGNHGHVDYWVVKLDAVGNLVWQKALGGSDYDIAYSVWQTADGGFIVAGISYSMDNDVSGNHGSSDYWIVKLNTDGNLVWQKSLGGSNEDVANSIQQTSDGGFIIAGNSYSTNNDVSGNHGFSDCWVVKVNIDGTIVWQKSLGGTEFDGAYSIQQTTDGGFVLAGVSFSNDGEISGNHGNSDYWIAKIDSVGNLVWQKSLGGTSYEQAHCVKQTTDGGFIIAGWSNSTDVQVSGNHGLNDYWIVKLSSDTLTGITPLSTNSFSLFPNPVQTQLTITLATPVNQATVRIYDLQGRMISLPTTLTPMQMQLNTEKLPDGFYTLQIINNKTGECEAGKFVKQ